MQKLFILFLISCVTVVPKNQTAESVPIQQPEQKSNEIRESVDMVLYDIKSEDPETNKHADDLKKQVNKWISYYTGNGKATFELHLNRGQRFKNMIQTVLNEQELPEELYYLALIESGFNNKARSQAKAVGLWQFISGTAKNYQLTVNSYLDERRDPYLATQAASRYLKDMFNVFQSWKLALAGYNCGEYRVLSSIMKGKTRNYWQLLDKKLLPPETRDYVPKLLAAIILAESPEEFGFTISPSFVEEYPDVESIKVPSPVELSKVAKITGINIKTLEELNPQLIKKITPPSLKEYELWIPTQHIASVKNSYNTLAAAKISRKNLPTTKDSYRSNTYTVKRGENLSVIGKRFKISASYLKRINNLSKDTVYPGQKLRITATAYKKDATLYHRVRNGENLSVIARRYKVSINDLRTANKIKGDKIYSGLRLKIPGNAKTVYLVKSGDNLSNIAKKFNTDVKTLKDVNGIRSNLIVTNQRLLIPNSDDS